MCGNDNGVQRENKNDPKETKEAIASTGETRRQRLMCPCPWRCAPRGKVVGRCCAPRTQGHRPTFPTFGIPLSRCAA
ncbi:hypothetical protein RSAG8_05344, partial [Rhizoctonia solani AG-8 WAC10335]